jgi:hypothetical protein
LSDVELRGLGLVFSRGHDFGRRRADGKAGVSAEETQRFRADFVWLILAPMRHGLNQVSWPSGSALPATIGGVEAGRVREANVRRPRPFWLFGFLAIGRRTQRGTKYRITAFEDVFNGPNLISITVHSWNEEEFEVSHCQKYSPCIFRYHIPYSLSCA